MPPAGGLHPLVLVKVVRVEEDMDYQAFEDSNAINLNAGALVSTLSENTFFGPLFENVKLAQCKVVVISSSSDEEPTREEAQHYSELKGAKKLGAFARPGMNLFVRIWLPPPPSPGKHR